MRSAGKTLVALLMGLLVANPVCCCTLGKLLAKDHTTSGVTRSCCDGGTAGNQQDNEEPSHDCPCAKNRSAVVEHKASEITPHFSPEFTIDPRHVTTSLPLFRSGAAALPSNFDLPPPRALWRLGCRFLL